MGTESAVTDPDDKGDIGRLVITAITEVTNGVDGLAYVVKNATEAVRLDEERAAYSAQLYKLCSRLTTTLDETRQAIVVLQQVAGDSR